MSVSQNELKNEYFEWLYEMSFNNEYCKTLSYRKLFLALHRKNFIYFIKRDENRLVEGVDLRYLFAHECGYSSSDISQTFNPKKCSVLEMIVALAVHIEEQMTDPDYGDRTSQWIWTMIISLGLGHLNDRCFDRFETDDILERFLLREYDYDGKGGLFTIKNANEDLRDVEIWSQAMWYIDENFDVSI